MGQAAQITDWDIKLAIETAKLGLASQQDFDQELIKNNSALLDFSHFLYEENLVAKFNELVTQALAQMKCLNKYETTINMAAIRVPAPKLSDNNNELFCDLDQDTNSQIKCNSHYKYRRIDGKCNNLIKTNWGSAFHRQRRLLPPDFGDGVNAERTARDGQPLPNERLLSDFFAGNPSANDPKRSSIQMEWGQLVAHDTVKTLQYFGGRLPCCPPSAHPECGLYTPLPTNDPDLNGFNQTCSVSARSITCNACRLGAREQLSVTSSVMDLSNVYGFYEPKAHSLRTFHLGKLQTTKSLVGTEILPKAVLPEDQDIFDLGACNPPLDRPWLTCLKNGDGMRGNQQPLINSLVTVIILRHNQHCDGLVKVNPHWSDETLYQEARRLTISEYTLITYSEYLPSVFNQQLMDFFDLNVQPVGNHFSKYNAQIDPDVIQEYSIAAFRYGHTNVNGMIPVIQNPHSLTNISSIKLRFNFNQMSEMYDGHKDGLIKGMCEDRIKQTDLAYTTDIRNYMFFPLRRPTIIDLFRNDIFRGRDHGLPSYIYYVQYCTGIVIKRWSDLQQLIPVNIIKQLKEIYSDYRDIDLIIGGLSETYIKGAAVGPTFSCINGIQFYHFKFGDRFYFEHAEQPGSFNIHQLANIKTTVSLANLFCKTTNIELIQTNPMYVPSHSNPYVPCREFPEIDYRLWTEDIGDCDDYCLANRLNSVDTFN